MTYYSTSTLAPIRVPRAVVHDGRWWDTREGAPDRDVHLAAVGIVPLVDTARPADTDTHTHDRTVQLVDGAPTVVWVQRGWTEDEQTARTMAEAPDLTTVVAARLAAESAVNPQPWVQPLGAHDAYLPGEVVTVDGDRRRNTLPIPNVWAPPFGWENLDAAEPVGPQPWQPWDGIRPLYQVGAVVTHLGQTWESDTPNNSWEPGVFGWVPVA